MYKRQDALQNTLKISGQTGYPVNNTLYVVTLEDGVVKSGHIVTDGEQLRGDVYKRQLLTLETL